MLLRVESVEKKYKLGKVTVPALRGVSFDVEEGSFLAIFGPSGSGKTTLLNILGLLDRPTKGRVWFDDDEVTELNERYLSIIRKQKIGFIFQTFNLIPTLTAYENVELPLLFQKTVEKERKDRVNHLLDEVGLLKFAHHRPDELSGGQQQRVAIARALVASPKLILADEPTANLDSQTANSIIELMLKINNQTHTTFIFSTHDELIKSYASCCIRLHDGVVKVEKNE
jgi:putative ABC transport system ATP-binding protein